MAQNIVKLADAREQQVWKALRIGVVGIVLTLSGGLFYYFSRFWFSETPLFIAWVFAGLLMLIGVTVMGRGLFEWLQTRNLRPIPVFCPYCNGKNLFAERPKADFDCDLCNRTVHFADGEVVPVRSIECQSCHATHRVAVTLSRYVCDQCNHLMEINPESVPA